MNDEQRLTEAQMKPAFTGLATAAAIVLASSVSPATSSDTKTWYVYCEGADQGDHWAVFSENFWPHPMTEGYGRQVGSAAKAFFESRHDVRLEGCAAVNFVDTSLARHSRNRTAQLHEKMGDRVLYFPLPSDALPVEVRTVQAQVRSAAPEPASEPEEAYEVRRAMIPGASRSEPRSLPASCTSMEPVLQPSSSSSRPSSPFTTASGSIGECSRGSSRWPPGLAICCRGAVRPFALRPRSSFPS